MSLFALLQTGCLVAFAILLLAAGWQDLRTMRIANRLSVSIIGVYLVWASTGMAAGTLSVGDLAIAVACGAGMFLLGALAFSLACWAAVM
jgi:prepilin peptidase CpaA